MSYHSSTINHLERTTFILNEKDVLIGLDQNWNEALIQPQSALETDSLLGNSLFNYVNGDATQIWLGAMLQKARVTGYCENEYRCDSPENVRWCKMTVRRKPKQHLLIEHLILSQNHRTQLRKPSYGNIDRIGNRNIQGKQDNAQIIVCSNCCGIKYDSHFIEMADYCVLTGHVLAELFQRDVRYIVCPECIQAI